MKQRDKLLCLILLVSASVMLMPSKAQAFGALYVSKVDSGLYSSATQVVLMRAGTKTAVSIQSDVEGATQDFAMIIPVPAPIKASEVRTLPHTSVEALERFSAPRLVELVEQDPCDIKPVINQSLLVEYSNQVNEAALESLFVQGEYDVQVLSAKRSAQLERWLKANKYKLPDGASQLLQSYVKQGMRFLIAKVDREKVNDKQLGGKKVAALRPLRFHYDSNDFSLPVRLGRLNAKGDQELIVYIFADQRHEVVNHPNVAIPTNLIVDRSVLERFGTFYNALFDHVLGQHEGQTFVTEHVAGISPLYGDNHHILPMSLLGLFGAAQVHKLNQAFMLTRIHTRYTSLSEQDLTFIPAAPIEGGHSYGGGLRGLIHLSGARRADFNRFQARYMTQAPWSKPHQCQDPHPKVWTYTNTTNAYTPPLGIGAQGLAHTPREQLKLQDLIKSLDEPGLSGLSSPAAASVPAASP